MQCSRCRTENEDSAKFCAACGALLHEVTAPTSIACPVCRHANAPGANFCVACGTNLRTAAQAAQPKVAPPVAPPTGPKVAIRPTEAAAIAAGLQPSAEAANKPQLPPRPRAPDLDFTQTNSPEIHPEKKSRFELAAGLAVLVLFLGGGGLWWNNQNNARMAEMALSAAAPTKLAKATQETTPSSATPALSAMPEANQQGAAAPPAVVDSAAGKPTRSEGVPEQSRRTVKRKPVRRHVSHPEPVPVVELSQAERAPAAAPPSPAPVERRRPSGREQVAACRQLPLFEGEKCLWRMCNGKWGKDGCPSYER